MLEAMLDEEEEARHSATGGATPAVQAGQLAQAMLGEPAVAGVVSFCGHCQLACKNLCRTIHLTATPVWQSLVNIWKEVDLMTCAALYHRTGLAWYMYAQ